MTTECVSQKTRCFISQKKALDHRINCESHQVRLSAHVFPCAKLFPFSSLSQVLPRRLRAFGVGGIHRCSLCFRCRGNVLNVKTIILPRPRNIWCTVRRRCDMINCLRRWWYSPMVVASFGRWFVDGTTASGCGRARGYRR